MLAASDCELKLALGYDDSLQKSLTQTMLKQEKIFRNQVFELHRLYQTQKIMMKELKMEVSCPENSQPFVDPFSKHFKRDYVATELKSADVYAMSCSRTMNNHCLPEHRGASKHHSRPLDLELSGSHYVLDNLSKSYGCIAPEISAKMRYEAYSGKVPSMEDLELSLRAGSHTCQEPISKDTDKNICSQSRQPVYLRDSSGGNLINQPAAVHAIHVMGRSGKYDAVECISESSLLTAGGRKLQEKKYNNQGGEHHGSIEHKITSVKRKLFASYDVEQLDLNKPIPDESFDHSIYQWIPDPSKISSTDTSYDGSGGDECSGSTFLNVYDCKKLKNNRLDEPQMVEWKDTKNSTLAISPDKSTSALTSVDLGSICGSPSESKDLIDYSGNSKPENGGCRISFSDKTCQKISRSEMPDNKNDEGKLQSNNSSQELLEATDSNKSPVSCKSWITDDVSSSTRTGCCGIDMSTPKQKLYVEPSVGTKAPSPNQKKEDKAEVDIMVKKGAVSLIYLSAYVQCSGKTQDQVPASKYIRESCEIEKQEVPQSSSESFESLVLKQPEYSPDEYCVTSTVFEPTSWDVKDCRVKVRRGRRMKDFRKEILPDLASLSRQAIYEDIKVLELAIRSREYKKHKSKNNNGITGLSSVRSRKSRFSCIGRKYYS